MATIHLIEGPVGAGKSTFATRLSLSEGAPLEERRRRVRQRNRHRTGTYRMEVSDEIFDLANRFWEEPSEIEYQERQIEIVHSH